MPQSRYCVVADERDEAHNHQSGRQKTGHEDEQGEEAWDLSGC